jgi:hypothetical protein
MVHIRRPEPDDEGRPEARPAEDEAGWPEEEKEYGPVDRAAFSVPAGVTVAKFALAAALGIAAAVAPQTSQTTIGLIAALAVAAYAARDLATRTRLVADADGLIVARGYAGHRRLAWSEIERLRVDTRTRLGMRGAVLEVDAGEEIYLFTRNDLGADPHEALEIVEKVRAIPESG